MTEQTPETTPDTQIDADQVVVNQAPDGGGIDNEESAPTETSGPTEGDSTDASE